MRQVALIGLLAVLAGTGCQQAEDAVEETAEAIDEATGVDTLAGPAMSGPEPQRVVVRAASYGYEPSEVTLARGAVWFIVANLADIAHGFEVEGQGIEEEIAEIAPGATDSLLVTLEQPGEYTIYCPVGDHKSRGMTGTLTVE